MNLTENIREGLVLNIKQRKKARINNQSVLIAYVKIFYKNVKINSKNNIVIDDIKFNLPIVFKNKYIMLK